MRSLPGDALAAAFIGTGTKRSTQPQLQRSNSVTEANGAAFGLLGKIADTFPDAVDAADYNSLMTVSRIFRGGYYSSKVRQAGHCSAKPISIG
jgi:hypothetical protein